MLRSALSTQLFRVRVGQLLASQQRLYAAEAAVAVKEPDWDTLSSLVSSDEAKRELASLRSQFNEIRQRLSGQTQKPAEVKWEDFKDVEPQILDTFKKAFASIKIPKLDVTEQLKKVESEFTPLLKSAEELEQFSKKRLEEIKAEIAELDDEMEKLSKRTIDEELTAHPELQEEVDKEISKGSYY